jgi:hypothetical protein
MIPTASSLRALATLSTTTTTMSTSKSVSICTRPRTQTTTARPQRNRSSSIATALPCLELLGFHITGHRASSDPFFGLDQRALYLALYTHKECPPEGLVLPYEDALVFQHCLWETRRGYEFLIANPGPDWAAIDSCPGGDPVTCELRARIAFGGNFFSTRSFIPLETATALSSKVKTDPFSHSRLNLCLGSPTGLTMAASSPCAPPPGSSTRFSGLMIDSVGTESGG